jgi:hypothetical protein
MRGLRAENDARTKSAEGASSIRTACETNFSAGKSVGLLGFHITLG